MRSRRQFLKQIGKGALINSLLPLGSFCQKSTKVRPNILWLSCEDIGPHLGCYGYQIAITPTLDKLASQGILFENATMAAKATVVAEGQVVLGQLDLDKLDRAHAPLSHELKVLLESLVMSLRKANESAALAAV